VRQSTKTVRNVAQRRPLAVLAAAAGLAIAGCADNNAPGAPPLLSSPPEVTSPLPAEPQSATLEWAKSMCQALGPAFDELDAPPQTDLNNVTATRQVYIDYLSSARNAAQQAIEQLSSVGVPPVDNGQQVLESMRNQLTDLRNDLDDALAQLNRANPDDAGSIALAFGAAGNVLAALGNRVQLLGNLATEPQLRAAIEQTPECQNLTE
jgi:hypothetical protein